MPSMAANNARTFVPGNFDHMPARPNMTTPPTYRPLPQQAPTSPIPVDDTARYTTTPSASSEPDLAQDPSSALLFTSDDNPPVDANCAKKQQKQPERRQIRDIRMRKRDKEAAGEPPIIDKPLSVLTADIFWIPLRDMKKWVNRDKEERLREVARKGGKIARPMNSFMMYRSAYADRTKEWCSQNNHQVVSRVAGQSWPLEPPDVREFYEALALLERDNHQKAHPEYKFAPNKTQTPPRRSKRELPDESSEGEDSSVRGQNFASPQPPKRARTSALSSSFGSRDSTPFELHESYLDGFPVSSWPLPSNRSMAPHVFHSGNDQGYFLPSAPEAGHLSQHQQYPVSNGLVGVPGGVHSDLMRPYHHGQAVTQVDDAALDPVLLGTNDLRAMNRGYDGDFYNPYMTMGSEGMYIDPNTPIWTEEYPDLAKDWAAYPPQ